MAGYAINRNACASLLLLLLLLLVVLVQKEIKIVDAGCVSVCVIHMALYNSTFGISEY